MNIKEFIYFFGCFYKYTSNRLSHHWLRFHISALQITLFAQGEADEGNALLILSFGVCRTMMVWHSSTIKRQNISPIAAVIFAGCIVTWGENMYEIQIL